jgi:hypothetical protein
LKERFVYGLEFFLGYQRILDPKGVQTLERGRSKKKRGLYEGGRWRCALEEI